MPFSVCEGAREMKCNNCGMQMKRALYCSEGWSEKLVILDNYDPEIGKYETTGIVMYCQKCGNLQVGLSNCLMQNRS